MSYIYEKKFKILEHIWDRNSVDKDDSDAAYFNSLMYTGELLTKLICTGLLAGVEEDSKRHKYSQCYNLVRSDGIGDWANSIDEILNGPTSHLLSILLKKEQKELTQKMKAGTWQHDSQTELHFCLKLIGEKVDKIHIKSALKNWFHLFARFRNKTRGHGAISSNILSKICPSLEKSLLLICNNFSLFDYEWAYISQNLSGKYKVLNIKNGSTSFNYLKSVGGKNENFESGIYIYLNRPVLVELIYAESDIANFYFPNGGFNGMRYEVLSYSTGDRDSKDSSKYLLPPGDLPSSETEGIGHLEVIENCFTNLPKTDSIYIKRKELENELIEILLNERHPMVTLLGRGGIGKTSLALNVLLDLCTDTRFQSILWFSSRDIDLLDYGAKSVQPQVLDIDDVAKEYAKLVNPEGFEEKGFNSRKYIENSLKNQLDGISPILLVFDNFETVKNPSEMFSWLDTFIRTPNKILITSRISEFKADYPITVSGMNEKEFNELVFTISKKLQIGKLIDSKYINKLYEESGGHPYVAKILLGVLANEKKSGDITRIVAGQNEMLTALFERTYGMLSRAAKKVFLTLSSWRSTIPKVGFEAIILTTSHSKMNVESAINQLYKFSFIDIYTSKKDGSKFISLPLSAYLFGQNKLAVSPFNTQVYEDRETLMMLGVGKVVDVEEGIGIRLESFFRKIAINVAIEKSKKLSFYEPMLEYICHEHYPSWLTYASLMEELNKRGKAILGYKKFIQNESDSNKTIAIWKKLAGLYNKTKDHYGEINSLLQMCEIETTSDAAISSCATRLNELLSDVELDKFPDEKISITNRLIHIMNLRINNGGLKNLDDRTKLAWIYVHLGKISDARGLVKKILDVDSNHIYAQKLKSRLNIKG